MVQYSYTGEGLKGFAPRGSHRPAEFHRTLFRAMLRIRLIEEEIESRYHEVLAGFAFAAFTDGLDGYLAKRFGWTSELGRHLDLFIAVHRLDFADTVDDETHGRVNVLNLVAGDEVEIETERGDVHLLSYAETIVVPAAVGRYRLRRTRGPGCKVVKAFVP